MNARRRSQDGFTLIELVAVLTITVILGAAVFARLPAARINLSGQAEQLVSDIRYAQSLAMTEGVRHCVEIDAAGYQFKKTVTNPCDTPVVFPGNTSASISLGKGMRIVSTPATYVFDGKGAPYAFPATALAAEAVVTVNGGDGSRNVRIVPETGWVYLQ